MKQLRGTLALLVLAWLFGAHSFASTPSAAAGTETVRHEIILIVGSPGEETFRDTFQEWTRLWETLATNAQANLTILGAGPTNALSDGMLLEKLLDAQAAPTNVPLWLVFLGHGTYDGREAKFNLRGPDLSAQDLAAWLAPLKRPVVIVQTASASGAFLPFISGTNRVVITATRSGSEQNFARFGGAFARAWTNPSADLDQDGQVSLLEAYLDAARAVREFYDREGRLATEHPLLDDNGDRAGTEADWFRGTRAVKVAQSGMADGTRARQLHLLPTPLERQLTEAQQLRRNALEIEVEALRGRKGDLDEKVYYRQLEKLLLELGTIYEAAATTQVQRATGP